MILRLEWGESDRSITSKTLKLSYGKRLAQHPLFQRRSISIRGILRSTSMPVPGLNVVDMDRHGGHVYLSFFSSSLSYHKHTAPTSSARRTGVTYSLYSTVPCALVPNTYRTAVLYDNGIVQGVVVVAVVVGEHKLISITSLPISPIPVQLLDSREVNIGLPAKRDWIGLKKSRSLALPYQRTRSRFIRLSIDLMSE
ncbi:hypothetical protein L873DRAFT_940236 [Choiromyces venosus 120613-1]|uniref:Uncharacterized protein n=1 Tax=Choiromyces venosus 120613-1 TaxID=1336337 RepID=A0A3N4K3B4_9PEZI|nr:hypothetical protein L873DRAFT_940236 [Choiromyces venosus 120613-1]